MNSLFNLEYNVDYIDKNRSRIKWVPGWLIRHIVKVTIEQDEDEMYGSVRRLLLKYFIVAITGVIFGTRCFQMVRK